MKVKSTIMAKAALLTTCIFIAFMVSDCKKDKSQTGGEINQYLLSLPSWEAFSPIIPDKDELLSPTIAFNCGDMYVTTTTPASITRTPADIVTYDPNSEILYVGSLIQGKGYLGGLGSLQSLPIYQRSPLTISISFQMADNSRIVENPNLATVKAAIGELVENAQNIGHVSGSSIFFNKSSSYSVQQTALSLGLSAKFMKNSVQASLEWTGTAETHTVSAYFIQKMFTVSMVLPQRPGDVFSSDFTQELLDEQISQDRIGPDNLPVFVSNVVYGRMMTLTMTSTYDETEMKAALEASYSGIASGSVAAEYLNILNSSTIQLVTIGGDANLALAYLKTGDLGEFFASDAPLTTAVPISYTLRNLGDNTIAKVSETVSYDMVQNEPVQVQLFTNEDQWRSAAESKGMTTEKFETTTANVQLANETPSFMWYGTQLMMWELITFSSANTGYPFDFHLQNLGAWHDPLALVLNDTEGYPYGFDDYTISIGDINDFAHDDFEIEVSGNQVYAMGFIMISNSDEPGEGLTCIAEKDDCYLGKITGLGYQESFVGVVSPVPLKRIWFDEYSGGGDDMGIRHFYFGYKPI